MLGQAPGANVPYTPPQGVHLPEQPFISEVSKRVCTRVCTCTMFRRALLLGFCIFGKAFLGAILTSQLEESAAA